MRTPRATTKRRKSPETNIEEKTPAPPTPPPSPPGPPPPLVCGNFSPRLGTHPLRCILTGSNPSATSAAAGHVYAHPSNRMWPILRHVGLAPADQVSGAPDDWKLPAVSGVGFLDVCQGHAETRVARLTPAHWARHVPVYLARLGAHAAGAAAAAGCVCGGACGAGVPGVVAFAGKAQWVALFQAAGRGASARPARCEFGPQPPDVRPPGWPFGHDAAGGGTPDAAVWVLPSTSGAAALSNEAREAPYRALAGTVLTTAWPRGPPACVRGGGGGGGGR
jgi:G:T/U-mismatch repair DNA glycosylase